MNFATPTGFRDFMPDEARLREKLTNEVQRLFDEAGYVPIETPTLESLAVMEHGGHIPGSPFKLFDGAGDLLAMRPDVTLQVARMAATRLAGQPGPFRFRYSQRVFRESETQAEMREMTQIGLECIGEDGAEVDAELIGLIVEALRLCGLHDFKISIGDVSVLHRLLEAASDDPSWRSEVLSAYHRSNFVDLDELCADPELDEGLARALRRLPRIRGGRQAIDEVRELVAPLGLSAALDEFATTFDLLEARGLAVDLLVDFSVMSSFDYYTGLVFEVFSAELGTPLGSGGRYDSVLAAYGQTRPAAGFAFYLESVMAAASKTRLSAADRPLRIAVPKGSLNKDTIRCLAEAGMDTTGLEDPGRALIISNPGVEYVIVRPTDAPVFVALGAADCGICGKDSLLEAELDVVELVDLDFGACRFVVAEPEGASPQVEERYRELGSIRVATKYPRITQAYYERRGVQVEVVKLHGNIELAPLTGMAERIVDITATGTTLRENHLAIVDDVLSSTARFFANSCAFRTDQRITTLARRLRERREDQR